MNACILTTADQPNCTLPGVVEVVDLSGQRAWGCPTHAIRALRAVEGARIARDLRQEGEQP
ncbi:hypothetical protein [Micromonospora narathiwatensis]|uniref:Uncharacterized protein n=1 Tax=Micromonospora narathiwatensis TaxID=299146 RepID=A0A1A9A640_9ACTN|nr:hypothetical protein [Micromonospora narathiwatensis]SBT51642.1 hypothetical protein GA0070621_4131 [Micromonospora narathiwatensis]